MIEKPSKIGADIFSAHARDYASARPGYAPELTRFLRQELQEARVGADIGSGTGIFTRELLQMGKRVYAVEPNEEMRRRGEELLRDQPGFISLPARAEATGLGDAGLDFITAASSFHWLEHEAFRREALRILKPGAKVYVIFNDRSLTDDFSREQHEICARYCPRFTSLAHGWQEAQEAFEEFFGPQRRYRAFDYPLCYSREKFLARSFSSSYSLTSADRNFPAYQRALEQAVDRFFPQGQVVIPNVTRLCFASPKT